MSEAQDIKTRLLQDIFNPNVNIEYFDSKILDYINSCKKPKQQSFADLSEEEMAQAIQYNSLRVNNQLWEFTLRTFFADRVKIYLPAWFNKMPTDQEGGVAYADNEDNVKFEMVYTKTILKDKMFQDFQQNLIAETQTANPTAELLEADFRQIAGKNIGFHQLTDGQTYSLVFFTSILSKALTGSFHCQKASQELWQYVFKGMLNTLRVSRA